MTIIDNGDVSSLIEPDGWVANCNSRPSERHQTSCVLGRATYLDDVIVWELNLNFGHAPVAIGLNMRLYYRARRLSLPVANCCE